MPAILIGIISGILGLYIGIKIRKQVAQKRGDEKMLKEAIILEDKFKFMGNFGLPEKELENQVTNYNTLKFYKSARGISVIFIFFSILLTGLLILIKAITIYAFIDIFILLVFAFFIYRGNRIALLLAMSFWTIEKSDSIIAEPSKSFIILVWWLAFMQAFYRTLQVEQMRQNKSFSKTLIIFMLIITILLIALDYYSYFVTLTIL